MKKWEYTVEPAREVERGFLSRQLNALGEKGWELVSYTKWLILKREVESNE